MAGDPCLRCKKNVTRAQGGIQCRTCTKWLHFSCASVTYSKEATEKLLGKWQCHRCKEVTNTPKVATVGTPNSQRQHNQGSITVSTTSTQSLDNNEPSIIGESPLVHETPTIQSRSEPCSYCHTQTEASTSFRCFFCSEWEHASCRGINSDIVLSMKLHDPKSILFRYECSSCSKRNVAHLQLQVRTMADRTKTVNPNEQGRSTLNSGDQALYSHVAQNGAAGLGASIPTAAYVTNPIETLLLAEKEKQLREEKRRNLVIAGIPESDNLNGIESQVIIELCRKNSLGATLEIDDFIETRRLGRTRENDKPRKLLVKLRDDASTLAKRNTILKNARILRNSTDPQTRCEIYIGPDLTRLQLQTQAERRNLKRIENAIHERVATDQTQQ